MDSRYKQRSQHLCRIWRLYHYMLALADFKSIAIGLDAGNIHSGPTPRGRGGSDAAFVVLARRGSSNAIDDSVCLPIFVCVRRKCTTQCSGESCHMFKRVQVARANQSFHLSTPTCRPPPCPNNDMPCHKVVLNKSAKHTIPSNHILFTVNYVSAHIIVTIHSRCPLYIVSNCT